MILILNLLLGTVLVYLLYHRDQNEWYRHFQKIQFDSFSIQENIKNTIFYRYYYKTACHRVINKGHFISLIFLWIIALVLISMFVASLMWMKILVLALGIILPLFLLEIRIQWVHGQVDQAMLSFFSTMNSNILQSGDLIIGLKEIPKMITCPYIREAIEHFNLTLKSGLSEEKAFFYLQMSTSHPYLKYVYLNMAQAYLKRGDVVSLMAQLEEEYTLVHIERNKRMIEMQQHRRYAWFAFGLVGLIGLRIAKKEDYLKHFYENTTFGKITLAVLCILLLLTLVLLMHLSLKRAD